MAISNDFYEKKITLISKDGVRFQIKMKNACTSILLRNIIETSYDQSEVFEIPISVDSRFINYLVRWFEMTEPHSNMILNVKSETRLSEIMKRKTLNYDESEFFDVTTDDDKSELVNLASFLDIPELYHCTMLCIAKFAKGKSPEDFRRILERSDKPIPPELASLIPGIENQKISKNGDDDKNNDQEKRFIDENQYPLAKKVKFAE